MTSIEWTRGDDGSKGETWNPIVGCSRVSSGCERCYAETFVHRGLTEAHRGLTVLGKHGPRWNGAVRFLPERLETPLRWKKPRRIFVNSLSDLFHESLSNEQIAAVFGVMAACPQHTFQVLTKRARRMREWCSHPDVMMWIAGAAEDIAGRMQWCHAGEDDWTWPLANVHLGVSIEDQETANARIPHLLDTPAAVRWVSYEPALGPVRFSLPMRFADSALTSRGREAPSSGLDWIVVGGESGPGARPFDLRWARSLIGQCREAGTALFVKQLGAWPVGDVAGDVTTRRALVDRKGGDWNEWPDDLRVRMFPGDAWPEVHR